MERETLIEIFSVCVGCFGTLLCLFSLVCAAVVAMFQTNDKLDLLPYNGDTISGRIQHPTNILLLKIVCASGMCIDYTWRASVYLSDPSSGPCYTFCFVGDFFQIASFMWFFVLNLDMWNAMRTPLVSYKEHYRSYYIIVFLISVAYTTFAIFSDISWFCSSLPCRDQTSKRDETWKKAIFYTFPSITILAVLFSIYVWKRVRHLLESNDVANRYAADKILKQGEQYLRILGPLYILHSVTFFIINLGDNVDASWTTHSIYVEISFFLLMVVGDVWALLVTSKIILIARLRLFSYNGSRAGYAQLPDHDHDHTSDLYTVLKQEIIYNICYALGTVNRPALSPTASGPTIVKPPNSGNTFQFQHFGPLEMFDRLKEEMGVSGHYAASFKEFCAQERDQIDCGGFSPGKSGSFMFYTKDGRFLIKTVTRSELRVALTIMANYIHHIISHRESLLVRIYGLHAIRLAHNQKKIYFMVMEAVGAAHPRAGPGVAFTRAYDLKGSTVGRDTPARPAQDVAQHPDTQRRPAPLKDNDLDETFNVGIDLANQLQRALVKDTAFLQSQNIMDYSLLVGVHDCATIIGDPVNGHRRPSHNCPAGQHPHIPGLHRDSIQYGISQSPDHVNGLYFIRIIDVLQDYSLKKRCEHMYKAWFLRLHELEISCVDPGWYRSRLLDRVLLSFSPQPASRRLLAVRVSGDRASTDC